MAEQRADIRLTNRIWMKKESNRHQINVRLFRYFGHNNSRKDEYMLYKTWLADWLTNYVMPSAKDKTYTRYEDITNHHLIPKLGDYLINGTTESIVVLFAISLDISEQNNTLFVWTNSQ